MMTERNFQHDDNLAVVILEIIAHYQPIPTMNIWFELGEDDRFKDGIALAEVNEILSHLANRKRIFREDGDKWIVKEMVAGKPTPSTPDGKKNFRRKAADSQQRSGPKLPVR